MQFVELKRDFMCMPEGSVCEVIATIGDSYKCMWGSMNGSYEVLVPKNATRPYVDKVKELFKNKEFIKIAKKRTGKK